MLRIEVKQDFRICLGDFRAKVLADMDFESLCKELAQQNCC